MEDFQALCSELERTWHDQIPLSDAMQLKIESFDGRALVTRAALAPNTNVHGTAFAGSLYATQVLTGWGMVWLQLKLAGINGSIVVASGHIDYLKPLNSDLVSHCRFDLNKDELRTQSEAGKIRLPLTCEIRHKGETAARFTGEYYVKLL